MTGSHDILILRGLALVLCAALVAVRGGAVQRTPSTRFRQGTGNQLARVGCIDASTANLEDFHAVAGIGPRVAAALVAHCRAAPCTREHPPQGIRGLGPVLTARLQPLLCSAAPHVQLPAQPTEPMH